MEVIDVKAAREYVMGNYPNDPLLEQLPKVEAVEVTCHCCDCYYLLNGKNSLGLYFFCGHKNGLKNLRNTEKDFCPYAKKRMDGDGNG